MSDQAASGWYPQPDGSQRYWDGSAWMPHQAAAPLPAPVPVYAAPGGYQVTPKSAPLSLLVPFFVPGLGPIINGETGKGVGILVGYGVGLVLSLILIGIPIAIGLWIWGMVNAYTGAQRWNAAHGILS